MNVRRDAKLLKVKLQNGALKNRIKYVSTYEKFTEDEQII